MIDLSTVTGVTIPEGVVTKIVSGGVTLWERISDTVILEVEKITSDTYANSTTYTGEQFILLDIYPKANGTVSVTYGGLTKTITDASGAVEPSEQQVFFGTFNGVSDEVATPVSGTLTISGDYRGFGTGTFSKSKSSTNHNECITAVRDFGIIEIIPRNAFYNCTKLASINIPNSVTSIGNNAFRQCRGLTSINIPSSITSIGSYAFQYCTNLASITIPSGVASTGDYAFQYCSNLTNANIRNGVTSIGRYSFADCTNLASVDIPSSITSIGSYAFQYCTNLASITIPSGVTIIDQGSFRGCTNLASVDIPSSITSIGQNGFNDCPSLTNITIPSGVTLINGYAFYLAAGNFRTITMLPTTPPTLVGSTISAFQETGTNHIIVPAGCGATYKSSSIWESLADYITEASV